MMLIQLPFSTMIVTASIVDRFGTNIIPPGEPIDVTPKEAKDRVYGSKMAVIEEESTIFTVWACKGCMLIIYSRLTCVIAFLLILQTMLINILDGSSLRILLSNLSQHIP